MSFALPVQRLRESAALVAFYHPQPAYPVHILLVPKRARAGLGELQREDGALLLELFQTAASLAAELKLTGYRVIVNGGAYQEVGQVHFHLISEGGPA